MISIPKNIEPVKQDELDRYIEKVCDARIYFNSDCFRRAHNTRIKTQMHHAAKVVGIDGGGQ